MVQPRYQRIIGCHCPHSLAVSANFAETCDNALLHCADVPICLYMAPFFDDTCARSVNCNMTELLQVTNISISLQKKQLSPKWNNGRGAGGFLMFQKVEWTYSHWLTGGGCADGLRPLLRKMSPLMEIRSGYLKDSPPPHRTVLGDFLFPLTRSARICRL